MNTISKVTIKTVLVALFAMSVSLSVRAQEESAPTLSISGSVDAYYRTNLNASNNPEDTLTLAPGTSFANNPGFSLGMANFIFSLEGERAGVVADLVFGPRGADAVFASPAPLNIMNQLYVYWNVNDALTLTLGNFNTFLGYEVISPTGNFNYSTSYMFSYGPFSHTGLKSDVALAGGFSLMGAIMNPTDATDFNPSDSYVGGFQLGYANDVGGAWLNSLVTDGFYQIDLTTGWDVSNALYLGFNATNSTDFYGAALYAQAALTDALALGVRGEYFSDENGVVLDAGEQVIDLTLSANYTISGLTLIPELRIDMLSYDGFALDGDMSDIASVDYGKSLSSFVLGAYYAF